MLDLSDNPIRLSLLHARWPQSAARAANTAVDTIAGAGVAASRAQRVGARVHGGAEEQTLSEFDGLVEELQALGFEF